tara:strand:+ start:1731 stop:2198 length:468 start_codon:yes stop_codon:yes gene_type:complete
MGRLEKLKRQAILEANQRNLGIIVEQSKLDAKEKEVSDHNKELEKEIESMTKKLESLVMDRNISKMQFKKTLSDLKKEKKLMKTQKKLEKQIEKAEKDIEKIESGKNGKNKMKAPLMIFAAGAIAHLIAGIKTITSPEARERLSRKLNALRDNLN